MNKLEIETVEQKTYRLGEVVHGRNILPFDIAVKDKQFLNACRLVGLALAEEREAGGWQPIETAPTDNSVLLYANNCPLYCGRRRYGNLGEPVQDICVWRCDSSGRWASPTHWMPLPAAPKDEVSQ